MTKDELEKLLLKVNQISEAGIKCEFSLIDKNGYNEITGTPILKPRDFKVSNFKQAALVRQEFSKDFRLSPTLPWIKSALDKQYKEAGDQAYYNPKINLLQAGHMLDVSGLPNLFTNGLFNHKGGHAPSIKYWTDELRRSHGVIVNILNRAPTEIQEDKETYRLILNSNSEIFQIFNEKHPHYQYADRGHFIASTKHKWTFGDQVAPYNYIITNELTPETVLCLTLINSYPEMIKFLGNEVFLNAVQAKVIRLRIEKEIQDRMPGWYNALRTKVFGEYDKIKNDDLLGKLVSGELKTGSYNDIKLTADSAIYEGVRLEYPGLLKIVMSNLAFDEQTDIYAIWRALLNHNITMLNKAVMMSDEEIKLAAGTVTVLKDTNLKEIPQEQKINEDPDEDEEGNLPETEDKITVDENEIAFVMKVNNFDVKISRVPQNTRRYVNGRPIKMNELERVCYRASCSNTQEQFDGFVKNVSQMSLEWHDALAEGVRVKIQDGMTYQELKDPTAPMASPKIKFRREAGVIGVVISDTNDYVPIKFNAMLKELKRINRMCTGNLNPAVGYGTKGPEWARFEIGKMLIKCCTFTEKQLVTDEAGNEILDANGKKQFNKVEVCKITKEQANFVERMAREYYEKARKREEEFLRIAVEKTGANLQDVQGEQYYVVTGTSGKQYAIHAKTNQVKAFPEMRHICIVEPGHVVSTGGDATAARLYALRNDKRMTNAITTLRN